MNSGHRREPAASRTETGRSSRTASATAFHVMAKPAGALCNMRCAYCFFLPKREMLASDAVMSRETLEAFVVHYLESQPPGPVVFTWQGGEPTLAGLDFYRHAVALQRRHCPPDKTVANDLQTNGLLLDDDWCRFLKEHDFLVGLSVDGPGDLHDRHRRTADGKPTLARVLAAAERLRRHGVPFNTLTVLHRRNAKRPGEVYRFLRDVVGSACMQFLPAVEPADHAATAPGHWAANELPAAGSAAATPGGPGSFVADWCVEAEDYGSFLCAVFDLWKAGDVGRVVLPFFESLLAVRVGLPAGMCVFARQCGNALALDRDGSVYFCDRFCYPSYRIGRLGDSPLAAIAASPENRRFGNMKGAAARRCKQCDWAFYCYGECPKNRFLIDEHGTLGLNYLCDGLRRVFRHVDGDIRAMAAMLREAAPEAEG